MLDQHVGSSWRFDPAGVDSLRVAQARAAFDRGEYDLAIVEAEELLDADPDNLDALFIVGDSSLELQDAPTAHAAFRHYLTLNAEDAQALSSFAIAAFEMSFIEEALRASERALILDPLLAEAWYFRGLALERTGDGPLAGRCFKRARELEPRTYPMVKPISDYEWDRAVRRAMTLLPDELRGWYAKVPLRTEHFPDLEELRRAYPPLSPTAAALYEGEAPDPNVDAWQDHPPTVRLFRGNLQRTATFEGNLPLRIAEALRNEALDWLALPLDALPLRA